MRVIVTRPRGGQVEHLAVEAPDGSTVEELILHLRTGAAPADVTDAGGGRTALVHGAELSATSTAHPAQDSTGLPRLVVATGPDAGGSVALPPGRWVTLGRDPRCDLTIADPGLSRRHVRVRQDRDGVRVEDLGSTNGMAWESGRHPAEARWSPGDRLVIGGSGVVLVPRPPAPARQVLTAGRREIVPWPRPTSVVEPHELSTPPAPERRRVRAPSAWTWTLPLVVALAVAVVLRMPWLLLFGLLGPAMVLGHHLGDRRAARLEFEEGVEATAEARAAHRAAARVCLRRELDLLRRRHPGLVGVVTSLGPHPSLALWQCATEPLSVTLGEHACDSEILLEGEVLGHEAAPLPLALDGPLVIAGDRTTREGLARAVLLQLATAYPPGVWTLSVDPDRPPGPDWDLLAWLPHTDTSGGVVEGTAVAWGRDLLLVDDLSQAPPGTTRVQVHGPAAAVLQVPGRPDVAFRPTTLGLARARSLARALAPLVGRSATREADEGPALPGDAPPLGGIASWPTTTAEAETGWRRKGLAVPLGVDAAGAVVTIDLARDGPHALVAGTTGSGKSELLRTLVTGLALCSSPADLALLLVDFKGGSSLGDCAALPHVTGLVTDLDPHLAARVLASLQAELTRRESRLAEAGVRDAAHLPGLPRLVVVIDEFRVLAEEVPEVMTGLVRLAAVGRSLGVHLVLATQRPAGVVGPDLRANVNLRVALRVRDVTDSLDVVETPAAALLPEGRPGLALWRTGAEPPRAVQVARVGPPAPSSTQAWQVTATPDVWAARRVLEAPVGRTRSEDDLGAVAEVLRSAARATGLAPPVVWHPPLPPRVDTLPGSPQAWALLDLPARQRREPLHWPAREHLAVVGAARSGRSTTLRSVLSRTGGAWVVVLDLGRSLEATELRHHPGLLAWVEPDDLAHGLRVLDRLDELVRSRQAAGGGDRTPVVWAVDGWDRLVDLFGGLERGRAEDVALRLLREGPAAGVVGLVTGDRSLLFGKVASVLPHTWAHRLNDPADLLMTGLRTHQLPVDHPPGRLVGMRDGVEAHVVLPSAEAVAAPPVGPPPLVCRPLPRSWTPGADHPAAWAAGGDEALPLPPPGGSFLVLGPPGSGRSHALGLLARGRQALVVDPGDPPDRADLERSVADLGPEGCVVVDDAHLLAGTPVEDALVQAVTAYRVDLLVAADVDAAASAFRGLVPLAARGRTGLVLQPTTASHGSVLGVGVPVGDLALPGRGVLVHRGRCTRVQVASPPPGRG
ncbi:FtsK/SpoIIIE domain-containing protein [Serinicoccus sediminis]|uniref:FtsK/SpoIIIE domain-containing protein n=1 Tax=Serinicoccus sediminis TaxID=2306021 RepID=UPI0013ECA785|nr:FtsK/SpoIIIE domain-containing protein [Serinicoccus sediminis]